MAPGAMGFVFAGPVASRLQKPLVVARKGGQLPGPVITQGYTGSNIRHLSSTNNDEMGPRLSLEMPVGSIRPGQGIAVIDDCLASGSTATTLVELVRRQGGCVTHILCVLELPDLGARTKIESLKSLEIFSIVTCDGQ